MPSPDRACLEIEHIFYADDDVLRHTVTVGFSGTPYITRQVPTPDELARRKQPGPDEAQEVQRLTQRRIFREQQEEMRPLLRDLLRNAYEQGGSSDWRDLLRGPEEPELDLQGNEDLLEAATPETYLAVNRYDVPAVRASGPRARETGCCGSPLRRRGGPRAGPVLASYDRNTPADTAPSRSRSNPPARCRHGPTVRGALRADQNPGHTRTSRLRLGRMVTVSAGQGPWEVCTTSQTKNLLVSYSPKKLGFF
ncbi:hypothetical protein OG249_34010 [Streptomyces microflavus]|uniref:hypothetical protein n=1 Tax=Streptomyces microflavus TaxID=1919 RepID=UPI00225181EA|nr:hypothetical protein [Streptomyces microflavus]MCX4656902.1 hypothetical protein [Streptomyces microflavus]